MHQVFFIILSFICFDTVAMEDSMLSSVPSLYQLCINKVVQDNYVLTMDDQKKNTFINLLNTDTYCAFSALFRKKMEQEVMQFDQPMMQSILLEGASSASEATISNNGNFFVGKIPITGGGKWVVIDLRTSKQLDFSSYNGLVTISPDERFIVSDKLNLLSLHDLTGKECFSYTYKNRSNDFFFSNNGRLLCIKDGSDFNVYQTKDHTLYRTYKNEQGFSISSCCSADGNYICIHTHEKKKIVHLESNTIILESDATKKFYFHPTRTHILYATNNTTIEEYELHGCHAISTRSIPSHSAHSIESLTFNDSGDRYIVRYYLQTVLCSSDDHRVLKVFDIPLFEKLSMDPSFRYYTDDKMEKVIDIDRNAIMQTNVKKIEFSHNQRFFVHNTCNAVNIWHMSTGQYYASVPRNGFVQLNAQGTQMVVHNGHQLELWNLITDCAQLSNESLFSFLLLLKQWLNNKKIDMTLLEKVGNLKQTAEKICNENIDTTMLCVDKEYSGITRENRMSLLGINQGVSVVCEQYMEEPFKGKLCGFQRYALQKSKPLTHYQSYKLYHTLLGQLHKMKI